MPVYYRDYLQLDKILNAQVPLSAAQGTPAHDERLFIIIHQVYELWFKQIQHELDDVLDIFSKENIDEKQIGIAVSRLRRITEIQKVLVDQLNVLETMTALDFLEFRHLLVGFDCGRPSLSQISSVLSLRRSSSLQTCHQKLPTILRSQPTF